MLSRDLFCRTGIFSARRKPVRGARRGHRSSGAIAGRQASDAGYHNREIVAGVSLHHETLEPRLALAITYQSISLNSGTAILAMLDGQQDAYLTQVADGRLVFADNSSFLRTANYAEFAGNHTTVFVSSGRVVSHFGNARYSGIGSLSLNVKQSATNGAPDTVSAPGEIDHVIPGTLVGRTWSVRTQTGQFLGTLSFTAPPVQGDNVPLTITRSGNWNNIISPGVAGYLDTTSGNVTLEFYAPGDRANVPTLPVELTTGTTTFSTYHQLTPNLPQTATVWDGHTINDRLLVRLSPDESRFLARSPVTTTRGNAADGFYSAFGGGGIGLTAEYVTINAPMSVQAGNSSRSIVIGNEVSASVQTRQLEVNRTLDAVTFTVAIDGIDANDDGSITQTERGQFRIKPQGSVGSAATTTFLLFATDADGYVESKLTATNQTSLFRSTQSTEQWIFSTSSPDTGLKTGTVAGTTVAINFGTQGGEGQSATTDTPHVIDLNTAISSLRITGAASSLTSGSFPVAISINDTDANGISLDATPESSSPISVKSAGTITVSGAIATVGGISLDAATAVVANAPITTVVGNINIVAPTVTGGAQIMAGVSPRKDDVKVAATSTDNANSLNPLNAAWNAGVFTGKTNLGALQLDGTSLTVGDRVLIKDRGDVGSPEQNGIYQVYSSLASFTGTAQAVYDVADAADANTPLVGTEVRAATAAAITGHTYANGAAGVGATLTADTNYVLDIGGNTNVAAGDRVLIKNQAVDSENGIYVVTTAPTMQTQLASVAAATGSGLGPGIAYSNGTAGVGATLSPVFQPGAPTTLALNIDGLSSFAVGDRILVKNQANPAQNGIYRVATVSNATSQLADARLASTANLGATYANGTAGVGATLTNNTTNLVLSVDGQRSFAVGDRILVKDQTTAAQNGIYVVTVAPNVISQRADARLASTADLGAVYANGSDGVGATLTNNTRNLVLSIDGQTSFTVGDRILVKDQANQAENGIYEITTAPKANSQLADARFASTANLAARYANGTNGVGATLTNNTTNLVLAVDGQTSFAVGDRILVKNQSTAAQNGVYEVTVAPNATSQLADARLASTADLGAQYANGSAGVGATLTFNSFGELAVDGVNAALGDRILVKNQTSAAQNGVYEVTSESNVTSLTRGVRLASTANLAATYANGTNGVGATLINNTTNLVLAVDGQTSFAVDDRILVKNQSTAAENGIYVVTVAPNATSQLANATLASTDDLGATYDNGAAGVGATLTFDRLGALSVDGFNAALGDRILVKNQTLAAQNGVYEVTSESNVTSLTGGVRLASTANLAATYANGTNGVGATLINNTTNLVLSVDGQTSFAVGDRILVKNQSMAAQNGVYEVTAAPNATSQLNDAKAASVGNLDATYASGAAGVGATLTANPSNLILSIDGQTAFAAGDRILVRGQTNSAHNGVYAVTTTPNVTSQLADAKVASTNALGATYSNGTAGVGATLTSSSNGALAVDGVSVNAGDRILVKDQGNAWENGIYEVTEAGDSTTPWVLTRATAADEINELKFGVGIYVQTGTTNGGRGFALAGDVVAIGTDTVTFGAASRWVLTRATDADTAAELTKGVGIYVQSGTANGNRGFVLGADVTAVGTDAASFTSATNWLLTRAVDANQAAELTKGLGVDVTAGSTNGGKRFALTADVTTVGTDAATFVAATNWVLTRATDADTAAELTKGVGIYVQSGTANGNRGFVLGADVTAVGTHAASFTSATNWLLTRAVDADQAAELTKGLGVDVTAGSTNGGKRFALTADVTTVGTDAATFVAATNWVFTRATDADTAAELTKGVGVYVQSGTANSNRGFVLGADVTAVGTDAASFTSATDWQLTRAADADAASKLTKGVGIYVLNGTTNGGKGFALDETVTAPGTTTVSFSDATWQITRTADANTADELIQGVGLYVQNGTLNGNKGFALNAAVNTVGTNAATFVPATNWVLTRAADANQPVELTRGVGIYVLEGDVNDARGFVLNSNVTAVGTDAASFVTANPWRLTRTSDADQGVAPATGTGELSANTGVYVLGGTTNGGRAFELDADVETVGTDSANFVASNTWQLTRATDADQPGEVQQNTSVLVTSLRQRWQQTQAVNNVGQSPILYQALSTTLSGALTSPSWLDAVPIGSTLIVNNQVRSEDNGIYTLQSKANGTWILQRPAANSPLTPLLGTVFNTTRTPTSWAVTSGPTSQSGIGTTPIVFTNASNNFWLLRRTADADVVDEMTLGSYVFATQGVTNANAGYSLVTPSPLVLDTTPLYFRKSRYEDVYAATAGDLRGIYHNALDNGQRTGPGTITGSGSSLVLTIDGMKFISAADVGRRVLVKDQIDASQNGIYTITRLAAATRQISDVRVATTNPLVGVYDNKTPGVIASTLKGKGMLPKIDGVALAVGDRVAVKNQEDKFENGIYVVTSIGGGSNVTNGAQDQDWLLTRSADLDFGPEFIDTTGLYVREGTANGGNGFVLEKAAQNFIVGSTGLDFNANTPWTLTRADDADTGGELPYGFYVLATNGVTNQGTGWVFGTTAPVRMSNDQDVLDANATQTATPLNFYAGTAPFIEGNGDISITSRSGALTVNSAVSATGDTVTLTALGATGSIAGTSRISGRDAILSATGSINSRASVAELEASAGTGITIVNSGAIDLIEVSSTRGLIDVSASSQIVATAITTGSAAAGDGGVSLTSRSGDIIVNSIIAQNDKVSLSATLGSILGNSPAASWMDWTAAKTPDGAFINNYSQLSAFLTAAGSIVIAPAGDTTLESIRTTAGNVAVTSENKLTVSSIDARGGIASIAYTGTGNDLRIASVTSDRAQPVVIRKTTAKVATTGNINIDDLEGPQTIDGVQVAAGDRVLVKDQADSKQNGLYVCAIGSWARASDADDDTDLTNGVRITVTSGSQQGDYELSFLTFPALGDFPRLGETALTFTRVAGVVSPLQLAMPVKAATIAPLPIEVAGPQAIGSGIGFLVAGDGVLPIIDGQTLQVNDRVLLKNQTRGEVNGVYDVTDDGSVSGGWVLTRSKDADEAAEMPYGLGVHVAAGTQAGLYQAVFAGPAAALYGGWLDFIAVPVAITSSTSIVDGDAVTDDNVDISAAYARIVASEGNAGTNANRLETAVDRLVVSATTSGFGAQAASISLTNSKAVEVANSFATGSINIAASGVASGVSILKATTALGGTISVSAPGDITAGRLGSPLLDERTSLVTLDATTGFLKTALDGYEINANKVRLLSRGFGSFDFASAALDQVGTFSLKQTAVGSLSGSFNRTDAVTFDDVTTLGGSISLTNQNTGDLHIAAGGISSGLSGSVTIATKGQIGAPGSGTPGRIVGGGVVDLSADTSIDVLTNAGTLVATTTNPSAPGVIKISEFDSVRIGAAGITALNGGSINLAAFGLVDGTAATAGRIGGESASITSQTAGIGVKTALTSITASAPQGAITILEDDDLFISPAGVNAGANAVTIATGEGSKAASATLYSNASATALATISGGLVTLMARQAGDITVNTKAAQIAGSTLAGSFNVSEADGLAIGQAGIAAGKIVRAATEAALPNSTYAPGTPGIVAASLTATTNSALVVDGMTMALNDRVLVKNQVSELHNGVYFVTSAGSATTPWKLTRATDADTTAELPTGTAVHVSEGAVNGNKSFVISLTGQLGTNALTATQPVAPNTNVTLVTTKGDILTPTTYGAGEGFLSGDTVRLAALGSVTARTDTRAITATAGNGSVTITEKSAVELSMVAASTSSGTGSVALTAGGSITAVDVRASGTRGSVALTTTSGNVTLGSGNMIAAPTEVTIDSRGTISAKDVGGTPIQSPTVTLTARGTDLGLTPALDAEVIARTVTASAPNGSVKIVVESATPLTLGTAAAATPAGKLTAAGSVDISSQSGDVFVFGAPQSKNGASVVRTAHTNPLSLTTFAPGLSGIGATLRGSGSINALNLNTGLGNVNNLVLGDRVLVANQANAQWNGIYVVTSLGGATNWVLTRAADSDEAGEYPLNSYTRVTAGANSGKVYQYTGGTVTNPQFSEANNLSTKISASAAGKQVAYIVTATTGENNAAGTLGNMIHLAQTNAANPPIAGIAFSSTLSGPIKLSQELPSITTAITVDGSQRISPTTLVRTTSLTPMAIDGTGITKTNTGTLNPVSVNGFTISAGATIANLSLGGFTKGSAISVIGGSNATIRNSLFGLTATNTKLANQTAVTISSGTSTTVRDNTIGWSTADGIKVTSGTGMTIRNNFIGTNAAGSLRFGNSGSGISLTGGTKSLITGNTISHTTGSGVTVNSASTVATIGTVNSADRNVISFNTRYGVEVLNNAFASIVGNSISANNLGGILSAASAGSGTLAAPVLTNTATVKPTLRTVGGTGTLTLAGTLPGSGRRFVDVYASPATSTGNQGQVYLGRIPVEGGSAFSGTVSFASSLGVAAGWRITATVTNTGTAGNTVTSVFSNAAAAVGAVSGPAGMTNNPRPPSKPS